MATIKKMHESTRRHGKKKKIKREKFSIQTFETLGVDCNFCCASS